MTFDEIIVHLAAMDGVMVQRPEPGDGTPEIAWGDVFFYYWPEGGAPAGQPFATITTKDYPGEPPSGLDRPGAFRVNVQAGRELVERITRERAAPRAEAEVGMADRLVPHPVYPGWAAVVDPAESTQTQVRELFDDAHAAAVARHRRRGP